jgi:hypothetical protein
VSESEDDDLSTTVPDTDSSIIDISRISQKDSSPDQTVQFTYSQTRKRRNEDNDSECREMEETQGDLELPCQSTPLPVGVNSESLLSQHSMKKRRKGNTGLVSKQVTL